MVELLAPVGSKEALVAAVEAGADAVYLAGKSFGARAYASNFDREDLIEAIRFAHMRNVLVDVAVNTIVDYNEFEELAEYLTFLYEAGADAIIVQDLGVAYLAKAVVPGLPLHASTQMTVHNIEGVRFLKSIGFERVVLSREMSLADIRYICENVDIEIEVFIHGALCVCYSGQCLMSGMIGGRSGNRGRCAQPCRLPYTLVDQDGKDLLTGADAGEFLLSPKDMNTLEIIPELIEAGIASMKIEGRMKRPEYVAVVVDTYRRAVDQYLRDKNQFNIDPKEQKELAQIFNRDFTTAYLMRRPGRLMMSDRRPNNRGVLVGRVVRYDAKTRQVSLKLSEDLSVGDILEFWVKVGGRVSVSLQEMYLGKERVITAQAGQTVQFAIEKPVRDHDRAFKIHDAALMEKARDFFRNGSPVRRIPIDMEVKVSEGQALRVSITDADGYHAEAQTDFVAQKAYKRPLSEETILKQMNRLGTSVFKISKFLCQITGEVMVPISEINEARRRAVEALEKERMQKFSRTELKHNNTVQVYRKFLPKGLNSDDRIQLSVQVDTVDKVAVAINAGADLILFGGDRYGHQPLIFADYESAAKLVKSAGKRFVIQTPRILNRQQMAVFMPLLMKFVEFEPEAIAVGNLGMLWAVREETNLNIQADAPLNIYNPLAITFLKESGVSAVTLSPELNFAQAERLAAESGIETECIVHGHLPLMVSEYCVMGSYLGGLDKGKCMQPCTKKSYWLLDRKGEKFPLLTDQYCHMHLLNGKELSMLPHLERFKKSEISRIRIEAKYMEMKKLERTVKLYRELIDEHRKTQEMETRIMDLEVDLPTRGHYFRGVLGSD